MQAELYMITTLTNMHVGSGDINFDIIDRQVQKDPTTAIPVIHGSSLKGAYREAAKEISDDGTNFITYIFGPEANDENAAHQPGAYHFFEARLLSRPVRSSYRPYYHATTPYIVKELLETLKEFGLPIPDGLEEFSALSPQEGKPIVFENERVVIEHFERVAFENFTPSKEVKKFFGDNLCLMHDRDFKKLSLPVIARNNLENGESKNLWYEEVVPRQSRFYFILGKPNHIAPKDEKKTKKFEERFGKIHHMHFGANKTVGYGYSKVQRMLP